LKEIFLKIPTELKEEVIRWGMTDTCWRETFMVFLEENLYILDL
jgi:hypothetical protein